MISASLFEDEQIQHGDVSIVFGSPLHLEKRPPTESIPLLLQMKFTASFSGLPVFTECFDAIRMQLTDELPTSYYDCIVRPNAVRPEVDLEPDRRGAKNQSGIVTSHSLKVM